MSQFQHGLCGCFDNIGVCLLTFFCPCYVFGKNAQAVGSSCLLCGLAVLIWPCNLIALMHIRGKVRKSRNIQGNCCKDLCLICLCTFCTMVQEAQEVLGPKKQTIARS